MDPQELRARRVALGLSQQQLATLFDVHHDTVSRWERGVLRIAAPSLLSRALQGLELARLVEPRSGSGVGEQPASAVDRAAQPARRTPRGPATPSAP
jgi:transcriptional regulator with XRE-family HTH domain